ncbi:chaperonin 10-like protein [Pseudomassariella vexata]|uniref:Chaperonin 10-like protein n=1 Tax=Pseudomassariella vexata TaxID=1141098 RepID=A0A1Y2DIY6_9PEZI|nr:chaperonin 10-like protein [Pseudomassariella vexata]ORY59189.1 chaperonin 10-like protein [Pseudomassariella vexata]
MPSFTVFKGSKDGVRKSTTTKPDELTGDQVLIKVTASGLCGTDLHYKTTDMALGHEGVGIVLSTGPACKYLQQGDRIGWGYEHDSCGHCGKCLKGSENYCVERAMYASADLDQGSFASHAIWREAFLFKTPDSLSDVDAAPLQCGGATVFNALRAYNTQSTETVGVMGVGGLGHLAIMFAAKMGCRVVVFSGSEGKREEAMRLGAHEFVAMKGKTELKVERKVDRLLVTTSAQPDWKLLLSVLAPEASIHPLSVDEGDFQFPYMGLVAQGLTVQGSAVAPRGIHKDMLEFAALHQIKPVVEKFPMSEEGIKEAMDKLERGDVRFRAVLVAE